MSASEDLPDKVALHARDVAFDWTGLTPAFVPGEPFASHLLNVLHILLPELERWFVQLFAEALPLIRDDQLREDVRGFIGQEAMHADAHQVVQDYFADQGLDSTPYVRDVEHLFRRALGDREPSGRTRAEWLLERLALVAAIEHVTAFLGNWVLDSPGLDAAGGDPRMLDLIRWHGAEEVEHRAVAFDVYMHLDGRYGRRIRAYTVGGALLFWQICRGVSHLMRVDPGVPDGLKPRWRDLTRAKRKRLAPGYVDLVRWSLTYFSPRYHPSREGSTERAVAYLAQSPAALAAEHRAG